MFNPEDYLEKLRNKREKEKQIKKKKSEDLNNPKFLEKCWEKAVKRLKTDTVQMENFRDIYGHGVDDDYYYIQARERDFKKNNSYRDEKNKKMGTILEAIFYGQIHSNQILGDEVNTISTCKYDDYKNGVDSLLEIKELVISGDSQKNIYHHIAIAIDATTSRRNVNLYKKIKIIQDEIKAGKLAFIKYFESENSNHKGALLNIPKFIIGVDKKTLNTLAILWFNDKNRTLSEHPFRVIILKEILYQLDYFIKFAQSEKQLKIVEKLKEKRDYFEMVFEEDKNLIKKIEQNPLNEAIFEKDGVFQFFKNLKENIEKGKIEYQKQKKQNKRKNI